jgi:hypothetical protein
MAAHIRRREFLVSLGSTAAWPLAVRAQQPIVPLVGILSSASLSAFTDLLGAFRQGLKETGYVEGQNVAIELAAAHLANLGEARAQTLREQTLQPCGIASPPRPITWSTGSSTTTS